MPDSRDQLNRIEAAIERAVANDRLSRRAFLRRAGRGGLMAGSVLSLPAILAACGIGPAASPSASSAASSLPAGGGSAAPTAAPSAAGVLNFANWPLYIDTDEDDESKHKTITDYEEATGSKVTYTEDIEDNVSFFGKIQPVLAAGQDTGYDLIVVTDWLISKMAGLGYLEQLDLANLPNFTAHAGAKYQNPSYDANNAHSVPWQSGITGIAYNPALTKRDITSFNDLLDPAFKGKIGMFTEMRDTMNLALLGIGVKPGDATIDDVKNAQKKLLEQAPLVRDYYDNSYADALASGDLAITMAWSGDVFQLQFDNPDLKFVVPTEGAILWVDNMAIPTHAKHPIDAQQMMNFVYQPEIAAQITEYVNYICPVPEAKAIIQQHAKDAADEGDSETSDYLKTVAASPLVFPTDEMLAKVFSYKNLSEDEEAQWNDLFQAVVQG
ncbi:MAG TPA: spermidine/putrescine ABC transporter substrate-binding protein [Candidatus Limnocylindria bacterium]|jgi:spermidine/putrescine transport system substrate-binding protein|nr:spermidine/putrescine ABC transporter substrate-binding protein [Candidatus Limnocylindria bacterium]